MEGRSIEEGDRAAVAEAHGRLTAAMNAAGLAGGGANAARVAVKKAAAALAALARMGSDDPRPSSGDGKATCADISRPFKKIRGVQLARGVCVDPERRRCAGENQEWLRLFAMAWEDGRLGNMLQCVMVLNGVLATMLLKASCGGGVCAMWGFVCVFIISLSLFGPQTLHADLTWITLYETMCSLGVDVVCMGAWSRAVSVFCGHLPPQKISGCVWVVLVVWHTVYPAVRRAQADSLLASASGEVWM